ncbi:MAG TPA: chemotaxis protein CheW [Candidatus Enterococcus avicola]|uniref:Chemotaxis protein CheW n=1 Tax=Candidatus Enterococcus avicola TaxID=2838561 RepID=A0A9D2F5V0_9ENTE|nr:chemotaxis protein CheW [Candidatus Enterococcus avicola]
MQMILFKMNEQSYLISADTVEEIIDTIHITKVPLAPNWVEGLINLRGTILTVVNLAELIQLQRPKEHRNIFIMKHGEEKKGLLIEEVVEVIDIQPADLQLKEDSEFDYYSGIVSFPDKVANVIDVNHLIFE